MLLYSLRFVSLDGSMDIKLSFLDMFCSLPHYIIKNAQFLFFCLTDLEPNLLHGGVYMKKVITESKHGY